jgi:hypothetical protein
VRPEALQIAAPQRVPIRFRADSAATSRARQAQVRVLEAVLALRSSVARRSVLPRRRDSPAHHCAATA